MWTKNVVIGPIATRNSVQGQVYTVAGLLLSVRCGVVPILEFCHFKLLMSTLCAAVQCEYDDKTAFPVSWSGSS